MIFHAIAIPGVLALVLSWTLAVTVLATGPGAARDRLLALVLVAEGTAWGSGAGFLYLTSSPAAAYCLQAVFITAMIALPYCYLAFIGTLPTPLVAPLRGRAGRLVLAVLGVAAEVYWLTHRSDFIGAVLPAWYATWDLDLPPKGVDAMNVFGAIGIVSLVGSLSAYRRAAPGSAAKRQARAFAIAFGVHDVGQLVFMLILPGFVVPPPPSGRMSDIAIILGSNVTTIVFQLLLSYGILKVQLFDIDLRLKRGIRRGTIAAVFLATFLIVEQLAQNYFAAQLGLGFGAITTGLLLFGLGPIRKFAERIAEGALPNVSASTEYAAYRKLEVYSAALESLVDDGVIDAKERALLEKLRVKLCIQPGDALALEKDALAERLGVALSLQVAPPQ